MKRLIIISAFTLFVYKSAFCQRYDSIIKLKAPTILNLPTTKGITLRKALSEFWNYDDVTGKTFGEFSAKDITGKDINTKNLIGKITLVNFSFSTCPPCLPEYEKLNRLYTHYMADTNFQLISFTIDNIDEARRTSEKYKVLYRIISASHDLCSRLIFVGHGYPSNYLLDENGKVTFGHPGGGEPGTDTDPFKEIIIPKIDSLLLNLKNIKKVSIN